MNTSTNALKTQAEEFALAYAARIARDTMRTLFIVSSVLHLITVIAIVVSYVHQAVYLYSNGMDWYGAVLVPLSLDLLTFGCVRVLGTKTVAPFSKAVAGVVMLVPISISATLNYAAPGAEIVRCAWVVPVAAIVLAGIVQTAIRVRFALLAQMERDTISEATAGSHRKLAPEVAAQRSAKRKATIARKDRERKAAARAERILAAAPSDKDDVVPVSPAPAGTHRYL